MIHKEALNLRAILKKNMYPRSLTDKLVKSFFDKMSQVRIQIPTVPKQEFKIVLPYLGSSSDRVKKNLNYLTRKYLPASKITCIFKSKVRLNSLFQFKDKLPSYLMSGVVYKYTCGSCNASYIGKTKRHTHHRFCEHAGRSPLSGKLLKGQQSTTVRDHMLVCDTSVNSDDFKIIGADSYDFYLKIKESLFIMKENPSLNIQGNSFPLALF